MRSGRGGRGATVVLAAVTLVGPLACKKEAEPEVKLAPVASTLAPSTVAPDAKTVRYQVDPAGKTAIDMPAPKEHIKAETTAAGGALDVDLVNLANTRGEVRMDLSTLTTSTFDDKEKNASQTTHARTWLEVVEPTEAAAREANRWAVYAIRSLEGLSAPSAAKAPKTERAGAAGQPAVDVRTVSLTAHGDYLLHGHKVAKDAQLEVRFLYAKGSPEDARPTAIEITTKAPFVVTLAEHDVKPRDTFGKLAKGSLGLLGTKVADTAAVTFELRVTPATP